MGPLVNKRRCKRGNDEADANALPKVLRKDHAAFRPAQIPLEGKSLALMGLESGSTFFTPATQETPADAKSLSDPDPLSLRNRNRTPSETLPSLLGKRPPRSSPEMLLPRRRYLSAIVGRDQQVLPGHPGHVPRYGRSRSTARVLL
ncbi:hypothetical protein Tco_1307794 [Tanacetum coccineum]